MPAVTFISLTPADAVSLSDIALRAYRDHYLDYWYDRGEWYMQRSFAPEVLAAELADPTAQFYSINLHNEPVGFLKINPDKTVPVEQQSSTPNTDSLELERIYLVKNATGHGVGRAAMQFVDQVASERSKQTVWLKAMDTSEALGFYTRLGFQRIGTLRLDYSQMREERRGMVILKKQV
jgi:diamine N-acetyltransferase